MESVGSMPHSQGLSNNSYPELIPRTDIYLFKVHSNIVLSSQSPNIVRVIKSRRLGHVARMEAGRSVFKILSGGPTHTGKIPLRRLRHRWEDNIRILKK